MTGRPDRAYTATSRRSPDVVMRLERMGSFFPTRLSFMRTLIRRLAGERVIVEQPVWEIDSEGYGRAVLSLTFGGHVYSLVAFSTPLADENRTDRVIAEAWDTTYVLYDGVPTPEELDRLAVNAPRQEAGRFAPSDLILSRANKSVRLFGHVVDSLAAGRQPDIGQVRSIGYLMRTTAVYGNGKFGIADRAILAARPYMADPFQAEMLTVWLIRGFTIALAEHVARARNPGTAVELARPLARFLGVGNATGLGMAPFLVSHPALLDRWMTAREEALARVRCVEAAEPARIMRACALLARAERHVRQWQVDDARQSARINELSRELAEAIAIVTPDWLAGPRPWDRLVRTSEQWSVECQELIVALVLEPNGDLIDDLAEAMASDEEPKLDPAMTVARLAELLRSGFQWALATDFTDRRSEHQFWYVSEDKLEPRLGQRWCEDGSERELPLDIARQAKRLAADLDKTDQGEILAVFLMRHPEHRGIVRRVQLSARYPYSEIRDNLLADSCLPIDMLRCKLSFFGASKFDPKSDRWTRITLFQGAPLLDEACDPNADDWWLPVLESMAGEPDGGRT